MREMDINKIVYYIIIVSTISDFTNPREETRNQVEIRHQKGEDRYGWNPRFQMALQTS